MTEIYDKSFGDLERFPVCNKHNCNISLELQNRFRCYKCLQIFCGDHRLDFNHECLLIKRNIDNIIEKQTILINYLCEECKCKLTEINMFKCKICDKRYCISHRLDFVHKCILK